jgi:hypothetical protein
MTFTSDELCYLAGCALLGLCIYGGIKAFCRGFWYILRRLRSMIGGKSGRRIGGNYTA